MKNNGKIEILSSFERKPITTINSVLSGNGLKPSYIEVNGEYVLSVKFTELEKAIQIASRYIEKKKLDVYCCSFAYWERFAPEYMSRQNNSGV